MMWFSVFVSLAASLSSPNTTTTTTTATPIVLSNANFTSLMPGLSYVLTNAIYANESAMIVSNVTLNCTTSCFVSTATNQWVFNNSIISVGSSGSVLQVANTTIDEVIFANLTVTPLFYTNGTPTAETLSGSLLSVMHSSSINTVAILNVRSLTAAGAIDYSNFDVASYEYATNSVTIANSTIRCVLVTGYRCMFIASVRSLEISNSSLSYVSSNGPVTSGCAHANVRVR
jgi:hypothetical protein